MNGKGIFEALIRMRRTLLIEKRRQVALRQQVHRYELTRLPVAGDLQYRRAGKTTVGKEQIFTKNGAVFGGDHRRHRNAREGLQLLEQRLMESKRHQPGAGR